MSGPTVIVLAAGQGTRMRSATPKMLHPVCGRPLVRWPIDAALAAGAGRVVVVGGPDRALEPVLPEGVELVEQREARGTADAVSNAAGSIAAGDVVIVIAGDVPLIDAETISGLAKVHSASSAAATILTMELDDPTGYGRIVRAADGSVERVVETKVEGDATTDQLALREVNTGVLAFDGGPLLDALARVQAGNAQGEHYLPDVLPLLREAGLEVGAHYAHDPALTLGVNDRVDLARAQAAAQRLILERLMRAGVTVVDPATTSVDADVVLGEDTILEPGCVLRGSTSAGRGCRIGPAATIVDSKLGEEVSVTHSYLLSCEVERGATIGPFAYLRPDAHIGEGSKVGTFVEVKNSNLAAGVKVPHLSYIGDADVGEGSNLGAGTITANYDGERKHRTTIGAGVRGGVDTAFVAPVTIGDGAWTAAGSVITEDVPPGTLAIARERQTNIPDYEGPSK